MIFNTRNSHYVVCIILIYIGITEAFPQHSLNQLRPTRTSSSLVPKALSLFLDESKQYHSKVTSRNQFIHSILSGIGILVSIPNKANADLNSAAEAGLPLVGRFEALKGAKAFIGTWKYEATTGISSGTLIFLKNGEVELWDEHHEQLLAVGAVPWKYGTVKGSENLVIVTFTLDQDDVLIYQGILDSAGGPERVMEGTISIGRAEIGARGSGPRKEVGTFSAKYINNILNQ